MYDGGSAEEDSLSFEAISDHAVKNRLPDDGWTRIISGWGATPDRVQMIVCSAAQAVTSMPANVRTHMMDALQLVLQVVPVGLPNTKAG